MTQQARIDKGLYWDRAWSLVSGCRPRSGACADCWAAREAHMREKNPNPNVAARYTGVTDAEGRFNGHTILNYDALGLPYTVKKPTTFAIWTELFYGDEEDAEWCAQQGVPFEPVPDEFIMAALIVATKCPQHTFLLLTKRAHRMYAITTKFCNTVINARLPENIVGMITAETQQKINRRLPWLLAAPFTTRGISIEPQLGPIDLVNYPQPVTLDVVIAGGESGAHARPSYPGGFRKLRDDCQTMGIDFFFKGWMGWAPVFSYIAPNAAPGETYTYPVEADDRVAFGDGTSLPYNLNTFKGGELMRKGTPKKAGRKLDGQTWDQLPWVKR